MQTGVSYFSSRVLPNVREDLREIRIRSWREMEPPQGFAFPGDPREWERKNCSPAKLTPLGEKLLGFKRWND